MKYLFKVDVKKGEESEDALISFYEELLELIDYKDCIIEDGGEVVETDYATISMKSSFNNE